MAPFAQIQAVSFRVRTKNELVLEKVLRVHLCDDARTTELESVPFCGVPVLHLAHEIKRFRMPGTKRLVMIEAGGLWHVREVKMDAQGWIAYVINKYSYDCVYGAMNINGGGRVGAVQFGTHGDAKWGNRLTETMNEPLVQLKNVLCISGDRVEVRGGKEMTRGVDSVRYGGVCGKRGTWVQMRRAERGAGVCRGRACKVSDGRVREGGSSECRAVLQYGEETKIDL